ncbi:MAG: L,D-transpeptidase [Armatimonadota bacterium]
MHWFSPVLDLLYSLIGFSREPSPPLIYWYRPDDRYRVRICKSDCTLTVLPGPGCSGDQASLLRSYPVAIGANPDCADKCAEGDRRTPEGAFRVCQKLRLSRPLGGYGPCWLRLDTRHQGWTGIGIHGTNRPASIGTKATAGCIRMQNTDVEELYRLIPLGTLVEIVP